MPVARAARSQGCLQPACEPALEAVSLHAGSVAAPGQAVCLPWHKAQGTRLQRTWAVQGVWPALPRYVWPCLQHSSATLVSSPSDLGDLPQTPPCKKSHLAVDIQLVNKAIF